MVRGRNDRDEDPRGVRNAEEKIEQGPRLRFSIFSGLESRSKDARMIHHCAPDTEGVAEVHGRHRSQGVDVFSGHPHALRVIMADAIKEAVFRRK